MRKWDDLCERQLAVTNDDFLAGANLFEVPSFRKSAIFVLCTAYLHMVTIAI